MGFAKNKDFKFVKLLLKKYFLDVYVTYENIDTFRSGFHYFRFYKTMGKRNLVYWNKHKYNIINNKLIY